MFTHTSQIALCALLSILVGMGCSSGEIVDLSGTSDTPSVVPHGKEDNFLAVSAREYLLEGRSTIVIEEADAGLSDKKKLEKAQRLIPFKQVAIAWFLNAFVAPKDKKDPNSKYGGFNALAKNATYDELEIEQVDELTFSFAVRQELGGPHDLLDHLPVMHDATGAMSFDLLVGLISNEDMQNLGAGDEWFRKKPWEHFDPQNVVTEMMETVRLTITPQPRSLDAWPDYARLFEDGKVTIGVHFGWDYHDASHVKESKLLYGWLDKQGYTSPVSSYEQLEHNSGPFRRTITSAGKNVKVEISMFWGKPGANTDPDTDKGGKNLKKDLIKSLETREIVVYSGHSGPFWGFSMGNWKKTEEGELDDNEITTLDLPDFYQVVLAEGCETYAMGSAFYNNPAKSDRTNLDIITTTTYSTAGDADPVKDFLTAMVGTWDDDSHAASTYGELMRDLDWNAWDTAMYGVHGIDDNPHLHPYAQPEHFCETCTWDQDCGDGANFCVKLGTDGQFCTAECTGDDGCPDGYTCAAVARKQTITGRACVPRHFSCSAGDAPTLEVVINEVMADPPNGQDGDLNEDGWIDPDEDEFVELVNTSKKPVDIGGWTVSDGTKVRFQFPHGVNLPKGAAAVVFGGGDPAALTDTGALLFVAEAGLRLANTGDSVILRTAEGEVVDRVIYGSEANNDHSLVRQTDGDKDAPMVPHPGSVASPGTMQDGTLY